MSAGNPFRRSRVPVEPDAASANIFGAVRAAPDQAASCKIACRISHMQSDVA